MIVRLLELEKVLYEWFIPYQEYVNMIKELIIKKTKEFLKKMNHVYIYARILFFFEVDTSA